MIVHVLTMLVGEGLTSMLGYESGGAEPVPIGPALLAGIPALLIAVAPGVAAVIYGNRAYRLGRLAARVPAWIGGAVAILIVVNIAALLVGR